jgi:hypothetical protein
MDKDIRYIYNPNIARIVTNSRGALKLNAPRHSRPVHRGEIRRIFARHAEWILADQIASRSPNARYLDIPQWHQYVIEVKRLFNRVGAGHHEIDVAGSLTKFGGKREEWKKRLDNAINNPLHWQQRRELEKEARRTVTNILLFSVNNFLIKLSQSLRDALSAQLAQYSGTRIPPPQPTRPIEPPSRPPPIPADPFHYDSDFSDVSIPDESDSEFEPDDLHLMDRAPWYCRVPPTLEVSQHVWACPGCKTYKIDLLQPDDDELEEIPVRYAEILRSKNWQKVTDSEVLMALGYLVSNHYAEHLRSVGIQFVTQGDKVLSTVLPFRRCVHKSYFRFLCENGQRERGRSRQPNRT